jgi:hypothetical protein
VLLVLGGLGLCLRLVVDLTLGLLGLRLVLDLVATAAPAAAPSTAAPATWALALGGLALGALGALAGGLAAAEDRCDEVLAAQRAVALDPQL